MFVTLFAFAGKAWSLPQSDCDEIKSLLEGMWYRCEKRPETCSAKKRQEAWERGAFYAGLYLSFCQSEDHQNAKDLGSTDSNVGPKMQQIPYVEQQKLLPNIEIKKLSGRESTGGSFVRLIPEEENRIEIRIDNQLSNYQIIYFEFSVYVGEKRYRFKSPPNLQIEPYSVFVHKYLDQPSIEGTIDERVLDAVYGKKIE